MSKVNPWREIAALGLLLINLSWLVPWFQAFTWVTNFPTVQVTLVIGMILLVAYILGRVMSALRLRIEVQVGLIAALILLSILWSLSTFLPVSGTDSSSLMDQRLRDWGEVFSVIPYEFLVIVALLFVWWWGLRLARERIGPHMAIKHFQIGSLSLLLYAAIVAGLVRYYPPAWIYALFLFSGLMAMGAARVSVVGLLRGGRRSPFNRRWLGEMLLATVVTLCIGIILAVLLTGQSDRIVGWLEGLVYIIGLIVASPIILILSLLAGWLNRMDSASFEVVPESELPVEQVESGDPAGMPFIEGGALGQVDLIPLLRSALTLILLVLALLMLYRFVRRSIVLMRMKWAESEDEGSNYRGLSGLGQLLREVLLGQAQEAAQGWSRRLNRTERAMAAERIRNIYVQLLELSEDLGHSRHASITPLEFLPELKSQFPGLGVDLRRITLAYNDIRYGELPETQRQLQEVEEAWRRVRLEGEANKKQLKRGEREVQPA